MTPPTMSDRQQTIMNDAGIVIQSVTHRFAERVALDDVSFGVEPATMVSLLGPNGGGKTTLFRILTTLLTPTAGTVLVAGHDARTHRASVRREIGVVFQSPSLDGKLSVAENLMHQGHLYGLSGETLRRRSGELLARFGVDDRSNDRVDTLSGGLRRRVELAKSLLHEPRILILDEPSTGLDPAARDTLMNQLCELRDEQRVTILLTTHLMDEADRSDTVAVLDCGHLAAFDRPSTLKAKIGGDVITLRTSVAASLASRIRERFSITATACESTVRMERERGHEFVPELIKAFPDEIDAVTVSKPTLDDVFFHLTGHRLMENAFESHRAA